MPTLLLDPATEPAILAGFDEAVLETARQGENALLQAKRTAAFEACSLIPNPEFFHEEYRRMDPALFRFGNFKRLDTLPESAQELREGDDAYDAVISVNEKGYAILKKPDIEGFQLCSLAEAAAADPDSLEQLLGTAVVPDQQRKFFELNSAFWNVGFFIQAAKGVTLEKGILIRYELEEAGSALLPRLVLQAESMASFSIDERYTSPDGVETLCLSTHELHLEAAADVRLVSLQDWGSDGIHLGEDWSRVKRDGKVSLFNMTLGGKTSKCTTGCDVCEENANAYLGGVFFADGKQHFDQKTLQFHSAPNTYSNMLYKGAVKDHGYSVYQGIIQALKNCVGVDAYQTNNNMVLDSTARADSLPGLIIDADELACSHGATMGNLDEEQLYYLRSRGIPEGEARRMLLLGFFDEVIDRIPFEALQDRLHAVIAEKFES